MIWRPASASLTPFVDRLRANGVLYDRTDSGEYFHVFTESFEGRFFFEIAQRVGAYDAQGEANAPVRMAAQARRYSLTS